ncbi:alpha/beta hydrolase [Streptomyces sp. NPDC048518]|uniref:alpha/beta hydrolase n=1 Tax=Streptomyces sp. NPDC048518 TaxID=3155029 RepID=UPI0033C4F03F
MRIRCVIGSAVALTLAGVGAPAAATDGDGPDPDLTPIYQQKFTWSDCQMLGDALEEIPRDMQCGKVTVPLDYAAPDKGTIELVLNRIPASGKKRGSLLLNFGGPGAPGVARVADRAKEFGDLTKSYDVVGFDPRGVGFSSPATCGDGNDQPSTALDGDENTAADVMDKFTKAYEECKKHSGPVLQHMGTINVSRDLDVMRHILGDKKLNFLGFSYGTRLGAVYTAQFPKNTGRLVLDGVDTLTEPLAESLLVGAQGQQTALDNFVSWCAHNEGCPLGANSRDAKQNIAKLVTTLNAKPVVAGNGQEFTGDDLVLSLREALNGRGNWPYLSQALTSLITDDDPKSLLRISGSLLPPDPDGSGDEGRGGISDVRVPPRAARAEEAVKPPPDDNFGIALTAVNCADDPDRLTIADSQDEAKFERMAREYAEASPIFGPAALFQVRMCAGFPAGTDFVRKIKNVHTPKFLLVGTRGDPATPYRWTVETAKRLGDSAVVLDNKGEGHAAYFSSKCVKQKVDDFLLYGTLVKSGSSCTSEN